MQMPVTVSEPFLHCPPTVLVHPNFHKVRLSYGITKGTSVSPELLSLPANEGKTLHEAKIPCIEESILRQRLDINGDVGHISTLQKDFFVAIDILLIRH